MRLLLVRHGETVDNVARKYAGITDSALTNHGMLQANYLATHLAATDVKISHIFSSDLQRAVKTAEAIRSAQSPLLGEIKKLQLLREQDFGPYEGKEFFQRPRLNRKESHRLNSHHDDSALKGVESKQSMVIRMDSFIDAHLLPISKQSPAEHSTVVVVAHGIILSYLWRGILKRFNAKDVAVAPSAIPTGSISSLEFLGGWSNTGYLELEWKSQSSAVPSVPAQGLLATGIRPSVPTEAFLQSASSSSSSAQIVPPLVQDRSAIPASALALPPRVSRMSLVVKAVNCQEHLQGLKKARGGIGNLKHDMNQKTVDTFFKKRRIE